jgi:hypothetical protein
VANRLFAIFDFQILSPAKAFSFDFLKGFALGSVLLSVLVFIDMDKEPLPCGSR